MKQSAQQEPIYFLTQADLNEVVSYVLSVPTGTLPGSRLAKVLNKLDTLQQLPPALLPILREAASSAGGHKRVDPPSEHSMGVTGKNAVEVVG
jgi:hypothetical protein